MKTGLLLAFLADLTACGGARAPTSASPQTFADQVQLGQKLYGDHCARCHGANGEGRGEAPAVVGIARGALPLAPPANAKYRKGQFKTVADIAAFVTNNMPPGKGGSLSADQYWAILAFDLKANGIDLDKKLDEALATTLVVPR